MEHRKSLKPGKKNSSTSTCPRMTSPDVHAEGMPRAGDTEDEMTSDNRQGNGIRLDHTPGQFRLWQSPFKSAEEIATRLMITRGGIWRVAIEYIGDVGDAPVATESVTRTSHVLWRDARGCWWIQEQVRRGIWLPDVDMTMALVSQSPDAPIETMCAEHIRNGQA